MIVIQGFKSIKNTINISPTQSHQILNNITFNIASALSCYLYDSRQGTFCPFQIYLLLLSKL